MAPDGQSSRVTALPEVLPPPYTHRLQLPADLASDGHSNDIAARNSAVSGSSTSESAVVDDGMEHLTQQTARLRFGRDLRLLEVS